jgi:hypothetical protein
MIPRAVALGFYRLCLRGGVLLAFFAIAFSDWKFAFLAFFLSLQEAAKFRDESPEFHRVLFFCNPSTKFPKSFSITDHFSFSNSGKLLYHNGSTKSVRHLT